jgi:murein DD-endopeptidase MepM/ murein hydrolase activator NlpD
LTDYQQINSILIFDRLEQDPPGQPDERPALLRILLGAFYILQELLYSLCDKVGIFTLEQLADASRAMRAAEWRAHQKMALWRRARAATWRHWVHDLLDPLRQFAVIAGYVFHARRRRERRLPLRTLFLELCYRIFRFFGQILITLFNIAAPLAACWLLMTVIRHSTGQNYGLSVRYDGTLIGSVSSEAQFEEVRRRVAERLGDGRDIRPDEVVMTLQPMAQTRYTDTEEMVNRLIELAGFDLFEGVGLYIDEQFIGSLESGDWLLDYLDERLGDSESGSGGEAARFNHSFSIRKGLYPVTSKTSREVVEELFTRNLTEEKTYTVREGDTPIGIANRNGILLEELIRLNPDVTSSLLIGDQLMIAHSIPYLRVLVTRTEREVEGIAFSTVREVDDSEYIGYQRIEEEGELGQMEVISAVTYADEEELERTELSRRLLRDPTPRLIIVGGKQPESSSAASSAVDTTGDIIDSRGGEMFIWPVDGGKITMPIWGYGGHTGNDITGIPAGTTIRAAASGVVTKVAYTAGGYGRHIIITHPNGMQTLYAHNSANLVQVGAEVVQGQKIAEVGQTGNAFGNHCHFEIRYNGSYLDARQYIGSVCPR